MKTLARTSALVAALALASCDVFLDDVGKRNEPCSDYHDCNDDLICVNDTCIPPPGLDEQCNPNYSRDEACEEGLFCITDESENAACDSLPVAGEPCICNWHGNGYLRPCDENDDAQISSDNVACAEGLTCNDDGVCE